MARAEVLLGELREAVKTWHASEPYMVNVQIAEDRMSWCAIVAIKELPEAEELGAVFGDAAHQLQSSLDHLAWALVGRFKIVPTDRRAVSFPIVVERPKWENGTKAWVNQLPVSVIETLERFQPFAVPLELLPDPNMHPLATLHRYDIMDKHYATGRVSNESTWLSATVDIAFAPEVDTSKVQVLQPATSTDFFDGAIIAEQHLSHPVTAVGGSAAIPFELIVREEDGNYVGLLSGLEHMMAITTLIIDATENAANES